MISIMLALSLVPGSPLSALQQEGWAETTFHRIYLRNGNFIDGRVISDKPEIVIMLLKSGEMGIKRDQIDHLELIKMKSWNDKAIILDTSKAPPKKEPPSTSTIATPAVDTPEAIRKRVDLLLFRYKNTRKSPKDMLPIQEIKALGEEAVIYLAASAPKFDLESQDAIISALIVLKPTPKVVEILVQLLQHDSPRSRVLALTVLCAEASDDDKAKYAGPLLRDVDVHVRTAALAALGATQDRAIFQNIVEMCADPEADIRTRALRIAKNLAEKHSLKEELARLMAANLTSSTAGVRVDAAAALGYLGQQAYWKDLGSALSDSDPTVRAAVAQAIMTLGAPESGEVISLALGREDDRWTRIYLAGAAQKLRIQGAVEPLIRWLSDPDDEIKKLASSTLQGITGQNFGMERDRWEAWWQANRK
ncbi:MAG TPA: HEAT repeat domain-containing protein [Planctomycetota bacterium]|nr:HEAT repeat domain-containing protein [Planctomycetota bacterium]